MKIKNLLVAAALSLALVAGCATTKNAEPTTEVQTAPLVIKNGYECAPVEYQIGEWIDDNKDGKIQEGEWYIYISDTLEADGRKEYQLPHGYYIIRVIVNAHGEILEGWAMGPIPDPELKPNEKTTLFIGCGKEHGDKHRHKDEV